MVQLVSLPGDEVALIACQKDSIKRAIGSNVSQPGSKSMSWDASLVGDGPLGSEVLPPYQIHEPYAQATG